MTHANVKHVEVQQVYIPVICHKGTDTSHVCVKKTFQYDLYVKS